jgi:hypothetical protein
MRFLLKIMRNRLAAGMNANRKGNLKVAIGIEPNIVK